MRKVLQINSVVNKGSTGRIAEQIGTTATQNRWESYIAYGRNSNPSHSNLIKIGTQFDVYNHILKSLILGEHGLGSDDATKSLIEIIKTLNPEIIHLHNIHGYYLNYKIFFEFLKTFKGKIIWTLHDCWSFTGHCTYFSDINCNKWITECNHCPKIKNYPKSLFFDTSNEAYFLKKHLFTGLDNLYIVTVSDWLKGLVKNSILQNYSVTTINNGVDLNIFKPQLKNKDLVSRLDLQEKFVMITASTSWTKHKGFDDYMKLSLLLNENEVIIMIGLEEEVVKKLPFNVIGIKKTDNQKELAEWYNIADLVLNLSYQETFGMTTAEGFACGKPSIVYNATASPELISKDGLGYIIEPAQINDVYHAVKKIKKNGSDFYAEICRNTAIEKYNMETQFQEYINLYEKID